VQHDEWPALDNSEVHGLQFFVNLPPEKRLIEPYAIHLESAEIPFYTADGVRIRVVAGEFRGVRSPVELPQPFAIFDGFLAAKISLNLPAQQGWNGWIYAMDGDIEVSVEDKTITLSKGNSIAFQGFGEASSLRISALASQATSHFIMMAGQPVG
jgi:redox-sensitive bicupin YhaK (pirin superfamily)